MSDVETALLGAVLIEDAEGGRRRYLRVTNPPPIGGCIWETTCGPRAEEELRGATRAVLQHSTTAGATIHVYWGDPGK